MNITITLLELLTCKSNSNWHYSLYSNLDENISPVITVGANQDSKELIELLK